MKKILILILFIITIVSAALCSYTIYKNKEISDNIISDILHKIPLLIESLESDYINDNGVKNLFPDTERLYYFISDVQLEGIINNLSVYENLNKKSCFYLRQLADDLKYTLQAIRNGRSYENGVEILKELQDILKLYSNSNLPFKKIDLQAKEKFSGGELHNKILEYSHSDMTFNYKNGDILFYEKPTLENELPDIKKQLTLSDDELNLLLKKLKPLKWHSNALVDRMPFTFDGQILIENKWLYFGYDEQIIFYKDHFCTATHEIINLLREKGK